MAKTKVLDIINIGLGILTVVLNSAEVLLIIRKRSNTRHYEKLLLSLSVPDLLVGFALIILSILNIPRLVLTQYAIPKIKMLRNLSCFETRFRLLCHRHFIAQQP